MELIVLMASLGWKSKCLPTPLPVGITVHLTQKVGLALEMGADEGREHKRRWARYDETLGVFTLGVSTIIPFPRCARNFC
jgi:hypothetical protein